MASLLDDIKNAARDVLAQHIAANPLDSAPVANTGANTATPERVTQVDNPAAAQKLTTNQTLMYVGIGVGVLAVIALVVSAAK